MIPQTQVRKFMKQYQKSRNLALSAIKAGVDRKTGRKLLEQVTQPVPDDATQPKFRNHATRLDPFESNWPAIKGILQQAPELEAKVLFEHIRENFPNQYHEGQLRTFQRKVKIWRAQEGLAKEVMFAQAHIPGKLSSSDFTHMNQLAITIQGKFFPHMLFHFNLTYSNWEHATICQSESFESFQTGFQNAVHFLGGMTPYHRTDSLSAAVKNLGADKGSFTDRFKTLERYYNFTATHTNPNCGHENGDVEQSHNRLKKAIQAELLLRGSRDFSSVLAYNDFLQAIIKRRNKGRMERFLEECDKLHAIALQRLPDFKLIKARVSKFSTVTIDKKSYSVPSRLIGENVNIRIYAQTVEIWYGNKCQDSMPRLKGEKGRFIQYRHIIDSLIRKPGAFNEYIYKEELFPSTLFRISYDRLKTAYPTSYDKQYIQILHLAAYQGESKVEHILRQINLHQGSLSFERVEAMVMGLKDKIAELSVVIEDVNLKSYDGLFNSPLPKTPGGENVE